MITIKNVKTLDDQIIDYSIHSPKEEIIEAEGKLLLLPAFVDSHIDFGSMSQDKNEKWKAAISSAIRGGITSVIEIPHKNTVKDLLSMEQHTREVNHRLSQLQNPLHYYSYAMGSPDETEEWGRMKPGLQGIYLFLDSLVVQKFEERWERVFQAAAWENVPVVLNFSSKEERDSTMEKNVWMLLEKSIDFAEKHSTRLYILNVGVQELEIIKKARARGVLVYAETTLEHLFQKDSFEADILWDAIRENVIETVGSGYRVGHNNNKKIIYKNNQYDFLDPTFLLSFLLTARSEGKISLEKIVRLLRVNIHDIFPIENTGDVVLVDLEEENVIEKIDGISSNKQILKGWPKYTFFTVES